jgi:hypothetical protein
LRSRSSSSYTDTSSLVSPHHINAILPDMNRLSFANTSHAPYSLEGVASSFVHEWRLQLMTNPLAPWPHPFSLSLNFAMLCYINSRVHSASNRAKSGGAGMTRRVVACTNIPGLVCGKAHFRLKSCRDTIVSHAQYNRKYLPNAGRARGHDKAKRSWIDVTVIILLHVELDIGSRGLYPH